MTSTFKTILFATDFSQASELPLEYARNLAVTYGAQVHVLHVLEEPFPMGSELYLAELPEFRERRKADAEQRLGEVKVILSGLDVTSRVVTGTPWRQIVDAATHVAADLIVMGTHGRSAVAHLFMGSVAERVVRAAPCPVLTVRAPRVASTIEADQAAMAGA